MAELLIAATTYNQSKYTKLFYGSLQLLDNSLFDLLIVDDASSDDTVEWCKENNINVITKDVGNGLTDSWNTAYKYFKDNDYKYFAIANNDILIPEGALKEMCNVLDKWPSTLVVPLSTADGCGHNKIQSIHHAAGNTDPSRDDPKNYQAVQDSLLHLKKQVTDANNLYIMDPHRIKMFNGFFFMMSHEICKYERSDGNLFDPKFVNVKNEDMFNWTNLINNNDFAMLCRTAFIFHWKGVSFTKAGISYSNNLKEHLEHRGTNR